MRPVQAAYPPMRQLSAVTGQPFVSATNPSVFRLEVINVPQYLNSDEFRAQFLKLDGCLEALLEKDDARQQAAYFVDFNTQELAEKCIASFTQWKGWGPKGLAFRRIGMVFPNLNSLPSADGGGVQPAKQTQISPSVVVKQGRPSNAYMSGAILGSGSVHAVTDQTAAMQGLAPQGGGVQSQPVSVMYQRPDGSLFVPGPGQADRLTQSLPPPSGVGAYPMQQNQAGGAEGLPSLTTYSQKHAAPGRKSDPESVQNVTSTAVQGHGGMNGIVSSAPSIQYVRLADGSLKAMMAVAGNEQPHHVNMLDQQAQPPVSSHGNAQSALVMNHGIHLGQTQHMQYSEAQPQVPVTGPPRMHDIHSGAPASANGMENTLGATQLQYIPQPRAATNPLEVAIVRSSGIPVHPVDNVSPSDTPADLPANASQTLYVDDVPLDMQKRELCHIFRPFGGFKEVRIVTKTTKEGRPYSFAFAQFENAECAAAALSCLNGYQYDPDKPELGAMQLKYARQERGKGGGVRSGYDDARMPNRPRLMRGDMHDSNENLFAGRFRKQMPDQKRARQHY